ncbi:MAG: hypothetical protein IJS60_03375 [Abditibacteriota bacterium]|nr:hypothetical protein [Abditibacteriota bacterium]
MKLLLLITILFFIGSLCYGEKIPTKTLYIEALQATIDNAKALTDGDPLTGLLFINGNQGLKTVLDLGAGYEIDHITIINGEEGINWLTDLQISAFPPKGFGIEGPREQEKMIKPLGRPVNLNHNGSAKTEITLPKGVVGRYIYLYLAGGGETASVNEIEIYGKYNKPERHLLYWHTDYDQLKEEIPYLQEIGITDITLDYVESAFPQTNTNVGFNYLEKSGVLPALQKAGIRYWMDEHEAFCTMITSTESLNDETLWQTTIREMEKVYSKAKELGFTGIMFDAENYMGPLPIRPEFTDHFTPWSFEEEWGYKGAYYHRGYEVGKIMSKTIGPNFINLYEARLYADRNDCRQGHYWFLKGMFDAGITNIRIATEKTYGAGKGELKSDDTLDFITSWFCHPDEEVEWIWRSYPFISGVIPGFHPWNTRLKKPMYLPEYLKEQIEETQVNAPAFWIYNEGNPHAGNPIKTLDPDYCKEKGVNPEDYIKVLKETK